MGSNVPFTVPSQGLRGYENLCYLKNYQKTLSDLEFRIFSRNSRYFSPFYLSLFYVLHDPTRRTTGLSFCLPLRPTTVFEWAYFDLFYVQNTHTRNVDASRRFVIQGGLAWANIVGICADVILHVCFGEILTCFTGEPGESDFQ